MEPSMSIAVAAEDEAGLDGRVAGHFGRCRAYVVVEAVGGEIRGGRVVPNPHAEAHRPGQMPRFIQGLGVDAILAGESGRLPVVRGCVAVAVREGADLQTVVETHFGRAPRFLLVRGDPEKSVEILENTQAETARGAGPATASVLIREGVTAALAGQFGPEAEDALRAGGILPITVVPGTTAEMALAGLQPEMLQGV